MRNREQAELYIKRAARIKKVGADANWLYWRPVIVFENVCSGRDCRIVAHETVNSVNTMQEFQTHTRASQQKLASAL